MLSFWRMRRRIALRQRRSIRCCGVGSLNSPPHWHPDPALQDNADPQMVEATFGSLLGRVACGDGSSCLSMHWISSKRRRKVDL